MHFSGPALVVLCSVAFADSSVDRLSRPFTGSRLYQSALKVAPFPQVLDLSSQDNLSRVVRHVAFQQELVMFTFSSHWPWLDWAHAMHVQLQAIGYQHHLAVALDKDCKALQALVNTASCGTYTMHGDYWEKEKGGIDYLWISRYSLANDIVRLTNTSVLMIDLDCFFERDVYTDLHSYPQSMAQLIHQEEGFANGGVFYIRNSAMRHGPALWIHDEVSRRAGTVKRLYHSPEGFSGTAMDQALCNDAINAAASLNGSVYDWTSTYATGSAKHNHPFWRENNRGNISRRVKGQKWYESEWSYLDFSFEFPQLQSSCSENATAYAAFTSKYGKSRLKHMNISIPRDDFQSDSVKNATEMFAAGLPYTFANYQFSMHSWRGTAALTHLVAASADFGDERRWTHCGRRAVMAARGAWLPAPAKGRYIGVRRHTLLDGALFSTKNGTINTLRRLFYAAEQTNRTPAVFGVPCSKLPWVARDTAAYLGVYDTRIIVHNDLCYPAPGGPDCWHDVFVYDFEIEGHHVPVHTHSDAMQLNSTPFVAIKVLPEQTSTLSRCTSW